MKKIFIRNLCLYMTVAMVIVVVCIFSFQTYLNQRDNTQSSYDRLQTVEEKLEANDEQIRQLTESLSENALAKTRAFAYMIAQKPEIIENKAELEKICRQLDVDELHVIDAKGIITHSTVDAYVGFDMGSGEQTRPFLEIISDPSLELAQEPQPNATQGILFQYIGVARQDAPGLVQVGVRPEVLENMLEGTAVDVALRGYDFGTDGYVFAIDLQTNQILAHKNEAMVGKDAVQAGFPEGMTAGKGRAVIDGVDGYYVAQEYDGMLIGTMMPAKEYYAVRLNQTVVVSASMFLIFIALLFMINRLVNRKIVQGIGHITDDLQTIAKGNLDLVIEEKGNPEFESLSDSINTMVNSIKENLRQNEELLHRQEEDMRRNEELIREVERVCSGIDSVSRETLHNSQSIHKGTEQQKGEVEKLNEVMRTLTERLKESAATSGSISETTGRSVEKMLEAKESMELLMKSIQEAADTSNKIITIIDEINSIASQTNMLSLNASIEAARAGEMGRGFAVVATQVGELAERSANAARETSGLIMNTIDVVAKGKNIAGTVVEEFLNVVSEMQQESQSIGEIADMANRQVNVVLDAAQGLERISMVVQNNVAISNDSEQTSENLAQQTSRLYAIVGQRSEKE